MSRLSFDPGRTIEATQCAACGREFTLVKGFVLDDDNPHAIVFAALHDHGSKRRGST
jgi:hypothetical protein